MTVNVLWLFLTVLLVGLQCLIVSDHTHILFCFWCLSLAWPTVAKLRIFLSQQIWISVVFSHLTYPYQPVGNIKNVWAHSGRTLIPNVIVMFKWRHHVASLRIKDFMEAFFMFIHSKMRYLVVSKKRNPLFMWGWDRKIRPLRPPFVITWQASLSPTLIFGMFFFYPTLTLMMDSWIFFIPACQLRDISLCHHSKWSVFWFFIPCTWWNIAYIWKPSCELSNICDLTIAEYRVKTRLVNKEFSTRWVSFGIKFTRQCFVNVCWILRLDEWFHMHSRSWAW